MSLAQIIYVSRRSSELTKNCLEKITDAAAVQNAQRDVTGVLMCSGADIIQLLEGELMTISRLAEHIRSDRRHHNMQILLCKNVNQRLFPKWGMAFADVTRPMTLDRDRLVHLIEDVQHNADTQQYTVEARMLLHDFKQQLIETKPDCDTGTSEAA